MAGGLWGEGTSASLLPGNSVSGATVFTGKTVEDATQAVADLFCVIDPAGAACP